MSSRGRGRGRRQKKLQEHTSLEERSQDIERVRNAPNIPELYEDATNQNTRSYGPRPAKAGFNGSNHNYDKPVTQPSLQYQSKQSSRSAMYNEGTARSIPVNESVAETPFENLNELRTSLPVAKNPPPGHSSKLQKALKPGYGTRKKKMIGIVSNFFRISSKHQNIYHYDIDITVVGRSMSEMARTVGDDAPKPLNKEISRHVLFEVFKVYRNLASYTPVFDGKKNLFLSKPLPINDLVEYEISTPINGREKTFIVAVKPVVKKKRGDNIIDTSVLESYTKGKITTFPEEIRMAYEAILAHHGADCGLIQCGFSRFFFPDRVDRLGEGLELMFGYNQNIRFTQKGTAIVINIAAAAFHKSGPVIDYASDVLKRNLRDKAFLNNWEIEKLTTVLKGLRVYVTHQPFKRKYKIDRVTDCLPRDLRFAPINGQNEISIEAYFRQKYNYRIRYNKLPLLRMQGKNVHLPFEVCEVVSGQRLPGRSLDPKIAGDMIKKTAIPPKNRFHQIGKDAALIKDTSRSIMEEFGLNLNLEPICFETRVLCQPQIEYQSNITPKENGTWDMKSQCFASAAESFNWAIISFVNSDQRFKGLLEKLGNLLFRVGNQVGLQLRRPNIQTCCEMSTEDALKKASEHKVSFAVVVLASKDHVHSYEEIKFLADFKFGLVTQCVDSNMLLDFKKFNDKYAANLCLKINAKLGGVNHILCDWPLALQSEAVIVIGADVVHSVNFACSSIAAVVGCINYNMAEYAVSCRALSNPKQNGKNQEIILELADMVKSILIQYYRNTKRKPQKILFYRDGISEGQFEKALETEVSQIKQACHTLEKEYCPPITYVVVQKRIQGRFKPCDERDGVGRMGNAPPGTVIDQHIVDPVNYDFYLISHEGIQGTTKPIYYTVLFDENQVSPDTIQILTYYLCYVYARCNRSISIPAPVKYADLLAYRAMHYVNAEMGGRPGYSHYHSEVPQRIKDRLKSIEKIHNRMFFI